MITLDKAEATDALSDSIRVTVPAGTKVATGTGWVVTVTQAGLECDCGKGVLCPLNPQERAS